jgi:hypothetical protein
MRSPLVRLAILAALAVSISACGGGTGSSLPYAGPPNNGGGGGGTYQSGSNGQTLLRVIQGSPDVVTAKNPTGTIDICVDQLSLGILGGSAAYGKPATSTANSGTLVSIPGGIPHTISAYPTLGNGSGGLGTAGAECTSAPGPYFGIKPIAVTTIAPGNNVRWTVVLAGTAATNTFGFYVFAEPSFVIAPAGSEVISHNAAPAFSSANGGTVGFGTCSTSATPCVTATTLPGGGSLTTPNIATPGASIPKAAVTSPLAAMPAGFYDGAGVATGTVAPITSVAAPSPQAGQPYIIDLYAIDAPLGRLGLVAVAEQALGYGF